MTETAKLRCPNRRTLIAAALAAPFARALPSYADQYEVEVSESLGAIAERKGILFGSAVLLEDIDRDPAYAALLMRECRILTAQNDLKWAALRPAPDRFDFSRSDPLVAFTESIGLRMRGHTLVWHEALPRWFDRNGLDASTAGSLLAAHIATVCGRYRGRLHSWDVVNEAVEPEDGRGDGLRETPWLRALGPHYIARAFHMAAAADPGALLVYNDYGMCGTGRKARARRAAVLRLLDQLAAGRVPIHALGIQAHLTTGMNIEECDLRGFLDDISDRGLQIMVTELDVFDEKARFEDPADQDARVANVYQTFLKIVLMHPATTVCITWGLSDRYSWLRASREGAARLRPLPFDDNHRPKPAWQAFGAAMDGAAARN